MLILSIPLHSLYLYWSRTDRYVSLPHRYKHIIDTSMEERARQRWVGNRNRTGCPDYFSHCIYGKILITGVGINRLISFVCRSISQQEDTVSFIEHENKVKENLGKIHNHRYVVFNSHSMHHLHLFNLSFEYAFCITDKMSWYLVLHSIRNLHYYRLHHLRSCGRNNSQNHLLR